MVGGYSGCGPWMNGWIDASLENANGEARCDGWRSGVQGAHEDLLISWFSKPGNGKIGDEAGGSGWDPKASVSIWSEEKWSEGAKDAEGCEDHVMADGAMESNNG